MLNPAVTVFKKKFNRNERTEQIMTPFSNFDDDKGI